MVIDVFELWDKLQCRLIIPRIARAIILCRSDRSIPDENVTQIQRVIVEIFDEIVRQKDSPVA
jgi:hypothetical protein